MAANCGRSQSDIVQDDMECKGADTIVLPSNDLPLKRIHKVMDRMSQVDAQIAEATETPGQKGTPDFPDGGRVADKTKPYPRTMAPQSS